MARYIIWHDNDFDLAIWLKENSTVLRGQTVEYRAIPKTNTTEQILRAFTDTDTLPILPFIRMETPDIIIQKVDVDCNKVMCVLEFMTHTPQWQHPAQRFSRIYNSAMLGVPSALILPHHKTKWEKGNKTSYKPVPYKCSKSVYQLFSETSRLTHCPTLIFNWPERDGYLKYDPRHATAPLVEGGCSYLFDFINLCLNQTISIDTAAPYLAFIRDRAEAVSIDQFDTLHPIVSTDEVISRLNLSENDLGEDFLSRQESIIFAPNGLVCANSDMRTDPYAGMLCAFDILFARDVNGNRFRNLVLLAQDVNTNSINFPALEHDSAVCPFCNSTPLVERHLQCCPFTQSKYRRIYGEIADLIKFDNTIFYRGRFI